MHDVPSIIASLGPAERLALKSGRATQKTSDKLAGKRITRFVKGPTQRAYSSTVWIALDLTDLGRQVVEALDDTATSS